MMTCIHTRVGSPAVMTDEFGDLPVGCIECTAGTYVYLHADENSSPNGKPAENNNGSLPDGWEERKSSGGKTYYVDHNTRTTSWLAPEFSSFELITSADLDENRSSKGLPNGWERRLDQNKRPYYVNHNTRTTTWFRPVIDGDETLKPLPQGWERARTEDGKERIYYVNHNDKTTSWDYPAHLITESTKTTKPSIVDSPNES